MELPLTWWWGIATKWQYPNNFLVFWIFLQNPCVLSADPCGSSSGSAISVAANLVAVSLGTETDGSILCPSSANSVVGIRPTVGLIIGAGVIPISLRQDTAGLVIFCYPYQLMRCERPIEEAGIFSQSYGENGNQKENNCHEDELNFICMFPLHFSNL